MSRFRPAMEPAVVRQDVMRPDEAVWLVRWWLPP